MNCIKFLFVLVCIHISLAGDAQQNVGPTKIIRIDTAGVMRGERIGETYIQYLSLNVELTHEGSKMYCDSCVLDEARKSFKAYGNVSILQPDGSALSADYIYYNGINKSTSARGNVVLSDPPSHLWTDYLDYDLETKIGVYKNGGVLETENTSLWSDRGVYNGVSHWTHFTSNVEVQGEDYYVTSRDLKYNTETKDVIFLSHSTIYKDQSKMVTEGGSYNSETQFADFHTPTTIYNEEQTIDAKKIRYDKEQGVAFASGDVHIIDTLQKAILFSDEAYYFDEQNRSIAYGEPLLIRYDSTGQDSILLLADTLLSFDLPSEINYFVDKDSNGIESTQIDTLYAKNYVAWKAVKFYMDSIQAIGDSLYYSELDSALRFFKNPIIWSDNRQMKGDTIFAFLNGERDLDSLKLMTNSSMLSVPQDIDEGLDQILGTWIDTYFEKGEISQVNVIKNAQNILYLSDDDDAYIGIYKSESNSVIADFTEGELDSIKLYENIDGEMIPLEGADFKSMRFERAITYDELRPMDKAIFYRRIREQKPQKKK